ncbi:acyltransferase family protein [Marinobacter sp. MDS2]|uniref:acyltransferase family protein n=1 Tax=Marinobacter sp. MDS2 TaxID=3065961 RepID=UPI00273C6C79|nr:acyltransferase family protein [Marinobacter sp. MDS2]MDP4546879.1 acyltransferase family protein [Marinobacter sp. MDS2]
MSDLKYRADIDGLRAFAVLPVILFHAGASWLPGGFVGVDIFFVISGYLISSIILREVQAGRFSFKRFYERRVRRIIPALLVMLLVTVPVFQVISLPDQAVSVSESGIAALLSLSNFYFWSESGYFSPTTEFMPLLHTWSLAVEEQFYFVFPIILIAVCKLRVSIKGFLVVGTIAAFAASLWLSVNKPSVAYYLLPARAWELAIGAVLATSAIPRAKSQFLRESLPILGIGLILLSVFYIHSDMIFPGWVALIPCLGAALVIHSDGTAWIARKVLMYKPVVLIGLLSYSLYLWHWPVLATLRVSTANVHLQFELAVAAILTTFVLAWLSWRFVEQPFRKRDLMPAKVSFITLAGGSVAMAALALVSIAYAGFPARLDESSRVALAAAEDVDPFRTRCSGFDNRDRCRFGNPDAAVTYAIIGDSHAAALRPAVEASELMGDSAGTLYWKAGCPLLDGAKRADVPKSNDCNAFREKVWEEIDNNPQIDKVILGGRWSLQLTGWRPEVGGSNRTFLEDEQTISHSVQENARVVERSLEKTLDRLSTRDIKVIVIGSVPEPGFSVPHTIALARYAGIEVPRGIPRGQVEERARVSDKFISERIPSDVQFIPVWESFCDELWCDIERNGVPIYYDDDHLSYSGAVSVVAESLSRKKE